MMFVMKKFQIGLLGLLCLVWLSCFVLLFRVTPIRSKAFGGICDVVHDPIVVRHKLIRGENIPGKPSQICLSEYHQLYLF